jgi:hypothetical protein
MLGTIADVWEHKNRGKAALSFVMAPFLGPSLVSGEALFFRFVNTIQTVLDKFPLQLVPFLGSYNILHEQMLI